MEILKVYTQEMPAFRFIGRKYSDADMVDGGFGAKWGEAFAENLFGPLEKACGNWYEDADAYVGLMRYREGEPMMYAIGMFKPADAEEIEGYESIDFPACRFGVGWIYGREREIYGQEKSVMERLGGIGAKVKTDADGAIWSFERYGCPRFTTPDARGNVILDVGFIVE
jgi:hypothetical protein